MRAMYPFKIIKHQLYLLQLENYNLERYLRTVLQKPFPSGTPARKELVWTAKLIFLFGLAVILQFIFSILAVKGIFVAILFVLLFLAHFIFLIFATLVLWPFDYAIKGYLIKLAKSKVEQLTHDRGLVVIGITGSYGKTTMKEVLATILGEGSKVLKTPESVNTPVGVARLILKDLGPEIEVLIVEMGAYRRGEIKTMCALTRPNIAILTGINEAHLERFGSIENTVKAKFEIVENSDPTALVVLNADDERVMANYQKYTAGRKVEYYSSKTLPPLTPPTRGGEKERDFPFPRGERGEGGKVLLGDYAPGVVNAAVIIAKALELTSGQIQHGIAQIKPIPHRLELISTPNDVLVIDDSYNANPDGVSEAIKVLARYRDKRKIYITPGLVEMGQRTPEIHREVGQALAKAADLVILIRNSVTPFIAEGILSTVFSPGDGESWREVDGASFQTSPRLPSPAASGCSGGQALLPPHALGREEHKIIWFDSASEAHASLPHILKSGDVILFQNDWSDNYL